MTSPSARWTSKRVLLILFLLSLASPMILWLFHQAERLKAKMTLTRMRELEMVLETSPRPCDMDCLKALVEKYNKSEILTDGRGNMIQVELMEYSPPGPPIYLIKSFGRDGKKGNCCERWVEGLDEDVVLMNDAWLQVWHY